MKRIHLYAFCAAALVISACEISEPVDLGGRLPENLSEVDEPELETFVFTSGPEEGDETKTEHSGSTIIWSSGDKIRMAYTVDGTWQGAQGNATTASPAKLYASNGLSAGGETASFTVPGSFGNSPSGEYHFYTIYPSKHVNNNSSEFSSDPPVTSVKINEEQTPAEASFDPETDLMLGHSVNEYTSKPTGAIPILWERKVAFGEITLKNLTSISGFSASEKITRVTLVAQRNAVLTGTFDLDLVTGEMEATNASNSVTVKGDNLSFSSDNNGSLTFWISIHPETLTGLGVTLVSDKATYTKTFSGFSREFLVNTRNKLGISMSGASRTVSEAYVLVESSRSDWSGDYVIAGTSGSTTYAMAGQNGSETYSSITAVSVTNKTISFAEGDPLNVKIESSTNGYTLKVGNLYLGYTGTSTSGNNNLYYSTTATAKKYEWTFEWQNDKTVKIRNVYNTSRYLQLNSSANRYAGYLDTQQNPNLYRLAAAGGDSGVSVVPPEPAASATVTTGTAEDKTPNSVTLNGSFAGASGEISEVGFYYGTSSTPTTPVTAGGSSSSFNISLSGLKAGTKYYYKAYVKEYDGPSDSYVERVGSVQTFTTEPLYYEKVTSSLSDWSGEYLIVYEAGNLAFNGGKDSQLHTGNTISVSISDGKIASNEDTTDKAKFTITKSGNVYTIMSASEWYIGNTQNSNYLNYDKTTQYTSSISYNSNGYVDIVSSGGAYLRYYSASGQLRFCYLNTSTYSSYPVIQLYRLNGSSGSGSGGGETPSPTNKPGYLGCYEIPQVTLSGSTSHGDETFGNTQWWEYDVSSTRKIITHTYAYNSKQYRNYTALIDKDKRCPIWTAYVLHKGAYPNNDVDRGDFSESHSYDPGIPRSWQSSGSTSDYNNGNGYARGHHCASEDRQSCRDANDQTFYYTNQSPQWQNSFNGGIWANLESASQNGAPSSQSDTLYVVVGTLFETNNSGSSNDGGTVGRPSHYYKLFMKCTFNNSGTMTNAKGIAYLFENKAYSGHYYDSANVTTIDAIEQRTGFDFFANVPESLQNTAETQSTQLW